MEKKKKRVRSGFAEGITTGRSCQSSLVLLLLF